ncbi:hypothetical protein AAHA92_24298 [Salvia divinorum]|uniref:Defensin-like domain-containing protein n=1 Tax=Salvia divinorum TaxID=28513 RepID=A0ABD1G6X7_SALDI
MGVRKYVVIFIISLIVVVASVAITEGAAVNPFCYAVCSRDFWDDKCLGLCIKGRFNYGYCGLQPDGPDILCCCQH